MAAPQVNESVCVREISYPVTHSAFADMIPRSADGITVEQFLRQKGLSHHVLVHLKHTERGILIDGIPVFSNRSIREGETVTVRICETSSASDIEPVPMHLPILYEDEDLLVIDKPPDLPVHPSMQHTEHSLANGVSALFHSRGLPFTYHCINRLDRDTSGLLIIAKHMLSACILAGYASNRQILREYLAITEGILPESGTIDAPIARDPDSVLKRMVSPEGERAVTHFTRIGAGSQYSIARIHLETGRTHQIRVHMKYIGHPLLGDFLYNPENTGIPGTGCRICRQALHAFRLVFPHPVTGKQMEITAPVPADFLPFIRNTQCSI